MSAEPTPDQMTAYLDDVQNRYQAFGESDAMPRLLAAVEAALAIHHETAGKCASCLGSWPCGEYLSLSRALLGGEPGASASPLGD